MKYLLIVLVPCLIALIVCSVMKSGMKTARAKTEARDYARRDSLVVSFRDDRFVRRTVERVPKAQPQPQQQQRPSGPVGGAGRK